ncbi:hypothetical protein L2E82_25411 [Cichorium intybus]|uniref:Uncharacterized protein n=1 Tax=Cichorium intybus TaxID=13427 RepID=A0ACB9E348_CICIN|nr:hypothetical protein L2E82_25411 [Cichorium intybus]
MKCVSSIPYFLTVTKNPIYIKRKLSFDCDDSKTAEQLQTSTLNVRSCLMAFQFDFLGKDSIRYQNEIEVELPLLYNMTYKPSRSSFTYWINVVIMVVFTGVGLLGSFSSVRKLVLDASSCGYDVQESMEKLMNMSSTTLDLGNATSSMVDQTCEDLQDLEIKSQRKLPVIDSTRRYDYEALGFRCLLICPFVDWVWNLTGQILQER